MKLSADLSRPETVKLSTETGDLHGLRWGTLGELPILAIHGWLDNAASFARLAPLLECADVVAIDLPGHGCSDHRPRGSRYHFIDYIPSVLNAMNELSWQSCVLIGHSLGAAIASFTAAVEPNRVRGLCLIDGLGPYTESSSDAPGRLQRSIRRHLDYPADKIVEYSDLDTMIDARHRASNISKASAALLTTRNAVLWKRGYRWQTDPRLRLPNPQYLTEEQVVAFFRKVEAPTVLYMASEGLLEGRLQTRQRIKAFSKIDVVELSGAHHFHLDNPQALAEALNRFLIDSVIGSKTDSLNNI